MPNVMSRKRPQNARTSDGVQESGFFAPYAEFAKTLRTWFVAYGIGAPVVVLSNDKLRETLRLSGEARTVTSLFLMGVGVQVAAALIYKMCMWYLYLAELQPRLHETRRYRISVYVSEAFGIELFFDLVTLGAFGIATWRLFVLLTR